MIHLFKDEDVSACSEEDFFLLSVNYRLIPIVVESTVVPRNSPISLCTRPVPSSKSGLWSHWLHRVTSSSQHVFYFGNEDNHLSMPRVVTFSFCLGEVWMCFGLRISCCLDLHTSPNIWGATRSRFLQRVALLPARCIVWYWNLLTRKRLFFNYVFAKACSVSRVQSLLKPATSSEVYALRVVLGWKRMRRRVGGVSDQKAINISLNCCAREGKNQIVQG